MRLVKTSPSPLSLGGIHPRIHSLHTQHDRQAFASLYACKKKAHLNSILLRIKLTGVSKV